MDENTPLKTTWENNEDGIKQLYTLYVADNQITFQKLTIFFAVNALLSNFIASLAKIDAKTGSDTVGFLSTPLGFLVGTVTTLFGFLYTKTAFGDLFHTHKYRVWYRDRIERAGGKEEPAEIRTGEKPDDSKPLSLDLFPTQDDLLANTVYQKSKTAERFYMIFFFVGAVWAIAFFFFAIPLIRFCLP
jgi:hypothetical protein